jgi:hypothetical protein
MPRLLSIALCFALSACSGTIPETRDCLVSFNGACLQYDFASSRGLNPLGNARQTIETDNAL